ncbi:uncharacterized protein MELLADRAFT_79456 [Melampsora larici-populina 98AG31]|uniref:Uncharacterized protein n=1 Tax=Melampsora larici-populina (strain 98AG31 / pathotype 3-4-7) TaxID=747676 RepID=F4S748_MELLP|nr:uncharacterized protein MELLADRAFT_79456 [Melampsora larici-populina 98AG31]EGF99530.1 hypothetical protein MELLADRAFT_79456 [Melampsora larici-populina 98AG31]
MTPKLSSIKFNFLQQKQTIFRRYLHNKQPKPPTVLPHLRTSIGRQYEEHVIKFMTQHFQGIQEIYHTGLKSSNDEGIDIKSNWSLPSITKPKRTLRIIAQCKDSLGELRFIRELESNLILPNKSKKDLNDRLIGILFTSRGFTLPALRRSQASSLPILLIHLLSPRLHPTTTTVNEDVDQFVWLGAYPNQVASQLLKPLKFVYGYSFDQSNTNDQSFEKKPVLWNSIQESPCKV